MLGDTVNIASRIESFSNIGGVLISDTVREQVKNQADWDFVSLGKFYLKNVSRPYEISAVAAEGLIVPDRNLLQGKGKKDCKDRWLPSSHALHTIKFKPYGFSKKSPPYIFVRINTFLKSKLQFRTTLS